MVNTNLDTYYGKISSHWQKNKTQLSMNVNVPVNTTAELHIPTNDVKNIIEGNSKISKGKDIKIMKITAKEVIVSLGSGNYNFIIEN